MSHVPDGDLPGSNPGMGTMIETNDFYQRKEHSVTEILIGQRVEIDPSTDLWMMGDRYGEIIDISSETGNVRILMDKSMHEIIMHPRSIHRYI